MAEELKIARATLAEHLSRIESIIMDDSTWFVYNFRISPDEFELFKDMAVEDSKNLGFGEDEQFKKLLQNMHENMESEGVPEDDDYENE